MAFLRRNQHHGDVNRELSSAHPELGSVLATSVGDDGEVAVATDSELAVRRNDGWAVHPWSEILSGGWLAEENELHWRLLDGSRHRVALQDPARVPEVFRERVHASIVLEQRVATPGGNVIISARRDPGGRAGRTVWHALPVGRTELSEPATKAAVAAAIEALQLDYGL